MAAIDLGTRGFRVFDNVLPDPATYREWALAHVFASVPYDDQVFHGIALCHDKTLPVFIESQLGLKTHLTFFRQSPEGQEEPNYIHSDRDMGDWTGILYLNPTPAPGDGTKFWQERSTGNISGDFDPVLARDMKLWACWAHVPAVFNRLLVFKSDQFHSRAIRRNYGQGDDARLIQVLFGKEA